MNFFKAGRGAWARRLPLRAWVATFRWRAEPCERREEGGCRAPRAMLQNVGRRGQGEIALAVRDVHPQDLAQEASCKLSA